MKFKLESNSTVQDLVVEDIASVEALMNTLDTSSLDQAFEELNDLQMLQQNIEKFGITEPVMDLVGGTLQSMNIRIDDKDACLEDLKETAKKVGIKIWEIVLKIFEKIMEFFNGSRIDRLKKHINALNEQYHVVNGKPHMIKIPQDYKKDPIGIISDGEYNAVFNLTGNFMRYKFNNILDDDSIRQILGSNVDLGTMEFKFETLTGAEVEKKYRTSKDLLEYALKQVHMLEELFRVSEKFMKSAKVFMKDAQYNEATIARKFELAARVCNKIGSRLLSSIKQCCDVVKSSAKLQEDEK